MTTQCITMPENSRPLDDFGFYANYQGTGTTLHDVLIALLPVASVALAIVLICLVYWRANGRNHTGR